jgi:hypothetical protein
MQKSFVQMVRQTFRQPRVEGVDAELGFDVLRFLNEVDDKFYKTLYNPEPQSPEHLLATMSEVNSSVPTSTPTAADAVSAVRKQPLLHRRLTESADRYWAIPVNVDRTNSAPSLAPPAGLVPTVPPAPPAVEGAPVNPLTPGVVLATHPLMEWPFSKCGMLVLESHHNYVSALILNYPRVYPITERNFVFPSQLRQQNCHIGGPMLSMDMPLVPNYHIIHPYPKIANAKVLLPDADRPICVSTGEDIQAISDYIAQGKAAPEDFGIFIGSVAVRKNELLKQIDEGFWMPIMASAEFVHSAGRLGRLFWDGLMEACGGEFAHMPLVSTIVERDSENSSSPVPTGPPQ